MTNQQWSVLLETVSFFFVAIDLYGRERLERTHGNLISAGEKLSFTISDLQKQRWSSARNKVVLRLLYVVAFLFGLIIALKTGLFEEAFVDGVTIGSILFSILLFLVAYGFLFLLITLVAVASLLFLMLTMFWISKSLIGGLIQVLRITKFEGLLLIMGSVLFVISKYLQLLA